MEEFRILPKRDDEKLERVNEPCQICGDDKHYPNWKYTYAGQPVVYCEECSQLAVKAFKRLLGVAG